MCRDPLPATEATLLVVPDDTEGEIETAIERVGGSIEAHLEFDAIRVRIPETQVTKLCSLDGIERVETAAVVSLTDSDESLDSHDRTE